MTPDDPRHGTTAGHAAGCRCLPCREVRNADERRRRKHREVLGIVRTVDKTGTVRRIQALWALGWTSAHIAAACGWGTPQAVTEIVSVRGHTYRTTAATIARAYDELSMTIGPSAKNRRDAARKGWVPPLAWDDIDHDERPRGMRPNRGDDLDPAVVERIVGGDWRLRANAAERAAVIERLTAAGVSLNEIERRTGWNCRRELRRGRVA